MAVVVIDNKDTAANGIKTTATFVLPITGDTFVSFNNKSPLVSGSVTMDINTTGLDANIKISLLQSNNTDETKANPIEDIDEVPIVEVLGNTDRFIILNSFAGLIGFASVDVQLATTGTIILTINSNGSK